MRYLFLQKLQIDTVEFFSCHGIWLCATARDARIACEWSSILLLFLFLAFFAAEQKPPVGLVMDGPKKDKYLAM